jgi:hypothetical protein
VAILAASLLSACTSAGTSGPSTQAAPTMQAPSGGASYYSAPANSASAPARRDRGTATRNAQFVEEGVSRTNVYPKFVPPQAATTQMTDAEKKAFQAQMAARIKTNNAQAESPAEYQERLKLMRALAQKHGEETLEEIEK